MSGSESKKNNSDIDRPKQVKKKLDIAELKARMESKIMAIPTSQLSKKKVSSMQRRNAEQDRSNIKNTMKILDDRLSEAENDGDQKKKYASIAVRRHELDNYNVREQVRVLELEYNTKKKQIPEETWKILSTFSELNDPKYWINARKNGYTDTDIALYYRDVWGLQPKETVKFLDILKIKRKMDETQELSK
jgi:hypothetical protein